jgi:hypothetical protein
MLAHEFQQTTTIPLPTTAQWQDATAQDWDLYTLVDAIRNQRNIQRDQIRDATLYKLWTQRKLEEEDGILYHNGHGENNRRHLRNAHSATQATTGNIFGVPRSTYGRPYRISEDILEDCSTLLLAKHGSRYPTADTTRMRALQRGKHN